MPSNSWLNGWLTGDIWSASEFSKGMGAFYDSTAGGAVASFDITSVPAWGSHLVIEATLRGDAATTGVVQSLRFNNDSSTNYSYEVFTAAGATLAGAELLGTTSARCGRFPAASAPASDYSSTTIDIPNFRGTTGHKSFTARSSSREGTTTGLMILETNAGAWFATPAAITRVTLLPASGNFAAGSRVTAYVMGP